MPKKFFKSVIGTFVDVKDDAPKTEKPQAQDETVQEEVIEVQTPKAPVALASTPATVAQGQEDDQIKEDLVKALDEANIEGYDYFEFRQALINMEGVIKTEPERFKATYAAVGAMITPERLIETALHYVGVLEKKGESFQGYVQQMTAEKVTANEEAAADADNRIQEIQAQIDQLNQNVAELLENKKVFQQEAIDAGAKIQQVQMNFNTTCTSIIRKIQSDAKKIETYLCAPKPAEKVEVTDE